MTHTAFTPPDPSTELILLPKCNLHTHLEGSIRPQTFIELAERQNIPLPFPANQAEEHLQVSGEEKSLVEYLDKIMVNYPVLKDYEALRRTAFEAVEDAFTDGVVYLELRAGPVTHAHNRLTVEMCVQAMLEGLQQAEEKFGVVARLIIAGLRNHDPAHNKALAEIALRYADSGVVGFDLAGDEAGYPAQLHQEAFALLRGSNLGITVHAGEAAGFANVRYAVETIGATRIGHGVHITESPSTMEMVRERQVLLELCPTSNVHTGAVESPEAHPVRQFFDFGIPISIGDDDPITSRTRVSNELMLLQTMFGFTLEELIKVQLFSLEHSFLREESLKATLAQKIRAFTP